MFEKIKKVYQEEGAIQLAKKSFQFGYNEYIRSLLPKRTVPYNGVTVQASRWGDNWIPWQETNIPKYEDSLVRGLRNYAKQGDSVVIVGGGWGVTTIVSAEQVGNTGEVLTYEGSISFVNNIIDTVQLNNNPEIIEVNHSIVAQAISLRGDDGGAEIVAPNDLPDCNVLVLDCEGAEIDILREMSIEPRIILVETHGMHGATETKVRSILQEQNYEVVSRDIAEERNREECKTDGIYVLMGKPDF